MRKAPINRGFLYPERTKVATGWKTSFIFRNKNLWKFYIFIRISDH
jgi:hypothetical protein